jgi:hypothetical protein
VPLLLPRVIPNSRLETDNRQLHQVVSQLRNARRTTQESADTALADRQTYLDTIEQLRRELSVLRERTLDQQANLQEKTQLAAEVESCPNYCLSSPPPLSSGSFIEGHDATHEGGL